MKDVEVASVVGARPNFIKLAPIHNCLKESLNHKIIHTGQHYDFELSEIFFKEFDLPKPQLNLEVGSGLPGFQISEMIKKIEEVLVNSNSNIKMVLVYGDTNSTFAGAFAAVKNGIQVAHIESGLRSFDRRMPEEINRILTDSISNYLFASTETAIKNLQNENTYGKIFNTGDLSVEIVKEAQSLANKSNIIENLGISHKKYILFTMHRAENTESDASFISIIQAFKQLSDKRIIFPLHPRTKKILHSKNLLSHIENCSNVTVIPPVGYIDFIQLMQNSEKIVTDSGGIQKESYLLSVPCITIRDNTEWIETIMEGWNTLVGTNTEKIVNGVKEWIPDNRDRKPIFGNGNTSSIIKKIITNIL